MTPRPTIAIAYASIGSGHRVAAEAVATELRSLTADAASVELLDVMGYGSVRVSGERLTESFTGPSAGLYDLAWHSKALVPAVRAVSGPLLRRLYPGFSALLAEKQYAAIVCTHALGALLAGHAVRRGRIRSRVVGVTTDYGIHGMWPTHGLDLMCVSHEDAREHALDRGFDEQAVVVTGVPVRPQFMLEYDRAAARRHFDVPEGSRSVLALAGSSMPGPYVRFKEALAVSLPAIASLPGTSVSVVTGRDEALAADLRARIQGFGTTNVRIFGYVERMAPLIAAADLVLAKPGGLICAECVSVGTPLVLVGPAVGQERSNARALTAAGAAQYAADPRTIAEHARKVISSPSRLKVMREAAGSIARPFAARDIAERVLALADTRAAATPTAASDTPTP